MPTHETHQLSRLLTAIALLSLPVASGLQAQQAELDCSCSPGVRLDAQRSLVLHGGSWLVDQDAVVIAARAELPLGGRGRWLLVPGLTYAHGDMKSSLSSDVLVSEAFVHLQVATAGRLRPYVGAGAGLSLPDLLDGRVTETLSAASGLRADLTREWGARLEADIRMSDGFEVGTLGWSLGVARRF